MRDLEIALQNYFKDGNPNELDMLLTSPNTLLDSQILPESHLLTREAITVLDSLNSYNQGLYNSELENTLLEIDENSPLYSWRCGVLAVKEFYNENRSLMIEHLNEIRENSPVKKIVPYMINKSSELYCENRDLNSSIDSLKDVISNSLIDMYSKTVKLLFTDLNMSNKDALANIALTIIEESITNIPLDIIQSSITPFLGLKETIRLMALGSAFEQPIKSIEYWFCYITESNFKTINDPDLITLFNIILSMVKNLIKEGYKFQNSASKSEFQHSLDLFLRQINKLTPINPGTSKNPLTKLKRALTLDSNKEVNTEVIKNDPIQRELF